MLYQYVQTERNDKNKNGLAVTYFLSGLTQPDKEDVQVGHFTC